jgi:uncharacterized protein GlcG (DUF336 family)
MAMTLALAEECIRRVKDKAAKMGLTVSIAVVDDTGSLVAYARMGERRIGYGEKVAVAKAKTAVAFRKDTTAVLEGFADKPGNYNIIGLSAMYPGEFWPGPGGVPVIIEGELVGAVGVAGPSETLHQCVTEALAGIRKI